MSSIVSHLHTVLKDDVSLPYDQCCSLLLSWITEFDRSAPGEGPDQFNDMHVVGMALCKAFEHATQSHRSNYDLSAALGHFADRIVLTSVKIGDMSWSQTSEVVATLQIEFHTLFEQQEHGGFTCCVQMQRLIMELMARLGFFLSRTWKPSAPENGPESLEVIQGIISVDANGWQSIRADSIIQVLDGLHAIAAGSWLILSARAMPVQDRSQCLLQQFMREASLDDFYEISMIADTPWGAISQYKAKFVHLFHSTSQVVYFHYPSYTRRRQLSMAQLQEDKVEAILLLPLAMQYAPLIPVIHEHTGAGLQSVHARHKWQWIVIGKFVLLCDKGMNVYHGDVRDLLVHAMAE